MSTGNPVDKLRGTLLVLTGACGYGVLSTFVKLAYAKGFTPAEVIGAQVVVGLLMLIVLSLFQLARGAAKWSGTRQSWLKTALYGSCTGVVSIFYYLSVQYLPASVAILLLMQFTWMSMCYEWVKEKRSPLPYELFTLILILTGTALASGVFSGKGDLLHPTGMMYGILAAGAYTFFLIVNKNLGRGMGPLQKSTLMVGGSCVLVLGVFPPVYLFTGSFWELWKWALPLAFFGMVLPPLAFAAGMPLIGLGVAAVLSTAELPVAVGMSWSVLGEEVLPLQWTGTIIIMTGIGYAHLMNKRG